MKNYIIKKYQKLREWRLKVIHPLLKKYLDDSDNSAIDLLRNINI